MQQRTVNGALLACCLAALLLTFIIGSRWPLVGDSVLMHYVVFLTQHGFAPYRDIAEMNLPLTYMSEQAAMTVFGAGDIGWRLYDGALVLAIVLLSWRLLRNHGAVAGIFAATLFAAVHLQDGIHMAGQRDLLVTVFQAAAGLALLQLLAPETEDAKLFSRLWLAALFGACSVAGACIKPPALLFALAGMVWLAFAPAADHGGPPNRRFLWIALAGATLPLFLCLAYLLHFGALPAFIQSLHGLIAYHAGLERRSLPFLLGHIWSPVLVFLVLASMAALLRPRGRWTRVDTLCAIGVIAGAVSYLIQGKGFPYQRYPFLLWALLLCVSRIFAGIRAANGVDELSAFVGYRALFSGVVLIVIFLLRAQHFSSADPYDALRADLRLHNAAQFDGSVQCLDTAGPCIGALYKERLTQSTGFLYDCYLLDGSKPVVRQQRALFERQWTERPPKLVVLTDSNCFTGSRTFDKYIGWPWMRQQLAGYELMVERHPLQPLHLWSRVELPYAYRILRRPDAH